MTDLACAPNISMMIRPDDSPDHAEQLRLSIEGRSRPVQRPRRAGASRSNGLNQPVSPHNAGVTFIGARGVKPAIHLMQTHAVCAHQVHLTARQMRSDVIGQ
jgi:hypothetical protein